jgi:hypothetical protein
MLFLFKLLTNKMGLDWTPPPDSADCDDEDIPLDEDDADEPEPDLFGDGPDASRDHQQRVITVRLPFFPSGVVIYPYVFHYLCNRPAEQFVLWSLSWLIGGTIVSRFQTP